MSTFYTAIRKTAKEHPEFAQELAREMVRISRQTSPTKPGAKKLFERYKEKHPGTKLTERDFLEEKPKSEPKGQKDKGKKEDETRAKLLAERARKKELPNDLAHYGLSASPEALKPEHREIIKDYNLDIVGTDAAQAVEIARKVKEGIEKSADVCKMSPPVCQGNMGLTRDKMPQIEGGQSVKEMLASDEDRTKDATFKHPKTNEEVPFKDLPKETQKKFKAKWDEDRRKGNAMVQAGADPKESRTVMQQMFDHLDKNGVKTLEKKIAVGELKATQKEIQAQKTFGMADAHLKGKFKDIDASVVISRDGHILDGHHRWAALLTIDPHRKMGVKVIDMDMKDLLKEAQAVPGVYQADIKGDPLDEKAQKKYKSSAKSKFKKAALRQAILRVARSHPEFVREILDTLGKM